eukprot:Gb_13478 [translate_table: standard]
MYEEEAIKFATLHLEEVAHKWLYHSLITQGHSLITTCEEFCRRLTDKFERQDPEGHFRELAQLRHNGTVDAYVANFQRIAMIVPDVVHLPEVLVQENHSNSRGPLIDPSHRDWELLHLDPQVNRVQGKHPLVHGGVIIEGPPSPKGEDELSTIASLSGAPRRISYGIRDSMVAFAWWINIADFCIPFGEASEMRPIISLAEVDWREELMVEHAKDIFATGLIEDTIVAKDKDNTYQVRHGVILYKERIFLVPESKLKKKIIAAFHDSPFTGHTGFFKTYRQVRSWYS